MLTVWVFPSSLWSFQGLPLLLEPSEKPIDFHLHQTSHIHRIRLAVESSHSGWLPIGIRIRHPFVQHQGAKELLSKENMLIKADILKAKHIMYRQRWQIGKSFNLQLMAAYYLPIQNRLTNHKSWSPKRNIEREWETSYIQLITWHIKSSEILRNRKDVTLH